MQLKIDYLKRLKKLKPAGFIKGKYSPKAVPGMKKWMLLHVLGMIIFMLI